MFVLKTAYKYAFSKTKGHRASSIMIVLGVALSMMAIIAASGIMNGLQNSQLRHLRNIESFDIVVKTSSECDSIRQIDGVCDAYLFYDTAAILEDKMSGKSMSCRIRGIQKDFFQNRRISESIRFPFDLSFSDRILIVSADIRNRLDYIDNDTISVTFLKKGKTARLVPSKAQFSVNGMYMSALPEFDGTTVFTVLETFIDITGTDDVRIGIYSETDNCAHIIQKILELDPSAEIIPWQEYNKAIFSALMLEKMLMYVFLSFIFLIICVNLKNSTIRLIKAKQKEAAVLRTMGCTRLSVFGIFVLQGFVSAVAGIAVGTVLGILILDNLGSVFSLADSIVFMLTGSRTVFSVLRINAEIVPNEILTIILAVILLSVFFSVVSCRRLFRREIMEVILELPD